ncbi:hypothetical protein CASFOL_033069 [Castilleja foliolosa]|uniref:UspA domain-containing protein n=1 Tax=Castilleja foliolosa TaxID=1961234 RepID=A0ABD3C3B2_9LAMI
MAAKGGKPLTTIMVAVNQSSVKGYPHASISCTGAFEWTLKKIVRSNASGFKILLLRVEVPDEDGFDDEDRTYGSAEDIQSMQHSFILARLKFLKFFVKQCHDNGVACEAWIKQGDPRKLISSEVKRLQPDLLVVGSRGLSFFQKIFIGSVSAYCQKNADCPVIVINRSPSQTPEDNAED